MRPLCNILLLFAAAPDGSVRLGGLLHKGRGADAHDILELLGVLAHEFHDIVDLF